MKVICISGKARHGKDSSALIMRELLQADGYKVKIIHYADLLKYICRIFFDWNGKKDKNGRMLLQYVGTDVIRTQCPDYWVGFVIDMLKFFGENWDYVLIPDTRFPNEIEALNKSGFETVHVRVTRPDFTDSLTREQREHPSETALDNTDPDYCVNNCGTLDDLRSAISELLFEINGYHRLSFDEIGG